jgi:ribonuclease HII
MRPTNNVKEITDLLKSTPVQDLEGVLCRYIDDPRASVKKVVEQSKRRIREYELESERIERLYSYEDECGEGGIVVGIDEVGRGALAGPLTVAAVVLPLRPRIFGLNDSKKLSPQRRTEIAAKIRRYARHISIVHVEASKIDVWGIAKALVFAMDSALKGIDLEPDLVLIDGNPVRVHPREKCIVKGDSKVASIAAASIVAKVTRDDLMKEYDKLYPEYGLSACKGYGSAEHMEAISTHGLSPLHRASFCHRIIDDEMTLF